MNELIPRKESLLCLALLLAAVVCASGCGTSERDIREAQIAALVEAYDQLHSEVQGIEDRLDAIESIDPPQVMSLEELRTMPPSGWIVPNRKEITYTELEPMDSPLNRQRAAE